MQLCRRVPYKYLPVPVKKLIFSVPKEISLHPARMSKELCLKEDERLVHCSLVLTVRQKFANTLKEEELSSVQFYPSTDERM
jgi:hypothetical protein